MNTIDLALKLIEFESTLSNPSETKKLLNFVEQYVDQNTNCNLQIEKFTHNEFETLIISTKSTKNPKLTFYAHLDVVAGPSKCFKPFTKDGILFGRGAGDMKGPAASMINAFIQIVNQNPNLDICLLLPTDEESGGHNCIKPLLDTYGFRTDCVIMPDSGSGLDTIITNQKGIIFTEITFHGISSHGSRPWQGNSAIQMLFDYAKNFQENFPKTQSEYFSTANPSIISGGEAFNSVAEHAKLTLDIRTANIDDHKQVIELLKSMDSDIIKHQNKFIDAAFEVSNQHPYLLLAKQVTEKIIGKPVEFKKEHGGSDGRFFQNYQIPCIVNGVDKKHSHGENEQSSIQEIHQLEEITIEFTKQFFSKANQ